MRAKFRRRTCSRVQGLSFHRKRLWILASLHSGVIELWDYDSGFLIHRYDGQGQHRGPIRAVHFHNFKPIFSSGGDDCKVKVWSYETHSCICSLLGHTGLIRTVQFHHEYPWIISASDDRTVRIWNWESRTSVFMLVGYGDSVMSAFFHLREDILLSASMDHTIVVWDFGPLREGIMDSDPLRKKIITSQENIYSSQCSRDDYVNVIFKDDLGVGVRWASFHPNRFSIVSGDNNHRVKLWKRNRKDLNTLQLSTLSRHRDNVSCVLFHWKNFIVSSSEDKTIRIWDATKKIKLREYACDENRFWILASHPERNFLAAGADNNLLVLKLERECPAFSEGKRGAGGSAVFVAQRMFAVFEKSNNQVFIKNLENETVKKSTLPIQADAIFYAGTEALLCRAKDRVFLFDLQRCIVLGDLNIPLVNYIEWSQDLEIVALLTSYSIVIADKRLVQRCTLHEMLTVEGGVWDDGVFVYSTMTHIKYCLPNGESGIIKTIDVPIYINKVFGKTIFGFDGEGTICSIMIDSTEYFWKLSLLRRRYDQVIDIIGNSKFGQKSMIGFLMQKGFPEVALCFVKDVRTRFNLALESGNMEIAVASAEEINEVDYWYRLGEEALHQGYTGIVEHAYQRTKNIGKLSFLYLITGKLDRLIEMMKFAEVNDHVMTQFHDALFLGDIEERVKILENTGHSSLAYITASVHGLHNIAQCLAAELGDNVPSLPKGKFARLLNPPKPISCGRDWPLLATKEISEGSLDNSGRQLRWLQNRMSMLRRLVTKGVFDLDDACGESMWFEDRMNLLIMIGTSVEDDLKNPPTLKRTNSYSPPN